MSRFEVPSDPVALRMENELLTVEVEYLRGRVSEFEAATPAERQADTAELEALREQVDELRQARSDLRWLLQRLAGSPAAPLLRRFSGFRTLVDRWSP